MWAHWKGQGTPPCFCFLGGVSIFSTCILGSKHSLRFGLAEFHNLVHELAEFGSRRNDRLDWWAPEPHACVQGKFQTNTSKSFQSKPPSTVGGSWWSCFPPKARLGMKKSDSPQIPLSSMLGLMTGTPYVELMLSYIRHQVGQNS